MSKLRLDRPGVALSIVLLGLLTFGLIDGGRNGWVRPAPVISIVLAALALVALVMVERRAEHPVLPPELLARAQVRLDILAATAATLVFYGMLFMRTLWYLQERGFSTPRDRAGLRADDLADVRSADSHRQAHRHLRRPAADHLRAHL